jgi:hypothetical protein
MRRAFKNSIFLTKRNLMLDNVMRSGILWHVFDRGEMIFSLKPYWRFVDI